MERSCRTTAQQDYMSWAEEQFRESLYPAGDDIARTLTAQTPVTFLPVTGHTVQLIWFLRWVLPEFSKCFTHECWCNSLQSFWLCPLSPWQLQWFTGRTAFPGRLLCTARLYKTSLQHGQKKVHLRGKVIRYLSFATSLGISSLASTVFYVHKVCHAINSLPLNSQR